MNCEIIAVGTELLLGNIVNTNAQFISQELAGIGIPVYFQTVVGDNPKRLRSALEIAFSRADLVVATGGLGPTEDDLTKEVAAEYFGKEMVLDQESLDSIESFFKGQRLTMSKNNVKQAMIPAGSICLKNDRGTAPGCIIEDGEKAMILLPGPPVEMTYMFSNYAMDFLRKKSSDVFFSKSLRICGVGESQAEETIKDLIQNQTNPTIAPYAKLSECEFRVTAKAPSKEEALRIMQPTVDEIYSRLKENIYGEDDATIESTVVSLLQKNRLTIACAESCSGGMLTAQLVNCSGVSDTLLESVVTYSNQAKMKRINVSEETLKTFGAVSKETALEMAKGIAETSGADVGVSITGIAGPLGGTDEKPVGLVYIGLCIKGQLHVKELRLRGDRQKIRSRAVTNALDFLRRQLLII